RRRDGRTARTRALRRNSPPARWRASCQLWEQRCQPELGRRSPPTTSPTSTTTSTAHRKRSEAGLRRLLHPHDQYRAQVIRAHKALGDIRLVTTDEVLTELLDGLAQHGAHLREVAAPAVRKI